MARYTYSETLTTKETKRRYLESVIYPKIPLSDEDLYIIASSSDRLDLLANQYYGNPIYWWVIAVANNINDGTLYIEEGKQIRIPADLPTILNELERINF
jgi:hypothetical protein